MIRCMTTKIIILNCLMGLFLGLFQMKAESAPVRLKVYRNKVVATIKEESITDLDLKRYKEYMQLLPAEKKARFWFSIFTDEKDFTQAFINRSLLLVSAKDVGLTSPDLQVVKDELKLLRKNYEQDNSLNKNLTWQQWLTKKWTTEDTLQEFIEDDLIIDRYVALRIKDKDTQLLKDHLKKLRATLTPFVN